MRAAALVLLLALAGCSGLSAYTGPAAYEPFFSVREQRVLDPQALLYPRWITLKTGVVTNPSTAPTHVYVSCGTTLFDALLPPRTSQEFQLQKNEGTCSLSYGVKFERLPPERDPRR